MVRLTYACLLVVASTLPHVSFADTVFRIFAGSGTSVSGGESISTLNLESSINSAGDIAFGATLNGPSSSGSAVLLSSLNEPVHRITFAPSSQRLYSAIQINDSADVVVRDRVSGAPAAFFARTWRSDGSFSVLADTNSGRFSGIIFPSIANDGGTAFLGLTDGGATTGLYVNSSGIRNDDRLLYTFQGAGVRPVIGDESSVLMRTGTVVQQLRYTAGFPLSPNYQDRIVSSVLMSRIGATPGISDDGTLAAFYAEDQSGAGIFVADLTKASMPVRVLSLGEKVNSNAAGTTIAALSPDTKVAIERIQSKIGEQYRLLFTGLDNTGASCLVSARVSAISDKVYDRTVLASANSPVATIGGSSITPTSIVISDPINSKGGLVFGVASASRQELITGTLPSLTKYKQFSDGNVFNEWWDKPINSAAQETKLFKARGCFITAVATVATHYGFEVNPLEFRDLALAQNVLQGNNLNLNGVMAAAGLRLTPEYNLKSSKQMNSLQGLVSKLESGDVALLRIPTTAFLNHGMDGTLHAVVAIGLDPAITSGTSASRIFVSDPGFSYSSKYGSAYTPGEQRVNVTLQDVFDRMNGASAQFAFSPDQWFNDRTFTRKSDGAVINIADAVFTVNPMTGAITYHFGDVGNMTFFDLVDAQSQSLLPSIGVNSPVEVVVLDSFTGVRYVSSETLLHSGDILLSKSFGEIGGDEDGGTITTADAYPHYSLVLPAGVYGHSLQVEIHGLADGSYRITFDTGSSSFSSSGALSGVIKGGEIVRGAFSVSAVPEPSSCAFMLASLGFVVFAARRKRQAVIESH